MTDRTHTDLLTAEGLIRYIAKDYIELSQEKIAWQRDDWRNICKSWLERNEQRD